MKNLPIQSVITKELRGLEATLTGELGVSSRCLKSASSKDGVRGWSTSQ